MQLWISVSLCILIYSSDFSGKKLFMSMHMYLDLMSEMDLLKCSFILAKSDVGVLTFPKQSIIFPSSGSLDLQVSVFCGIMSQTALT